MSDQPVITFYLGSNVFESLNEMAISRGLTVSQLIRELLFLYYQELSEVPPFLFGGEMKGDLVKVSVRLDQFLLQQVNQIASRRCSPRNSLVHSLLYSLLVANSLDSSID